MSRLIVLLIAIVGLSVSAYVGYRVTKFLLMLYRVKKYKDEMMEVLQGAKELDECSVFGRDMDE